MSAIDTIIGDLVRAGVDPDLIGMVAVSLAEARVQGATEAMQSNGGNTTARQARNRRYYEASKTKTIKTLSDDNKTVKTVKTEVKTTSDAQLPLLPSPNDITLTPSLPPKSSLRSESFEKQFSEFYSIYPRRVRKAAAQKAYLRMVRKDPGAVDRIAVSVKKFEIQCRGQDKQFIPHPATWLSAEGFDDEDLLAEKPKQGDLVGGRIYIRKDTAEGAALMDYRLKTTGKAGPWDANQGWWCDPSILKLIEKIEDAA